jgi:kynurenine formamidase
VAVLGSDGASERYPSGMEGSQSPIHFLVIYGLGMPILDNLDLEELSAYAAKTGRYEFMFTAAPLRVKGGTGSPLNPIATF